MNEMVINQLRFYAKTTMCGRIIVVEDLKYNNYAELEYGDDGDIVIKMSDFTMNSKRHFEMLYYAEVNKEHLLYGRSFELKGLDVSDLSSDFDSLDDYIDGLEFQSAIDEVVNINLASFPLSDADSVLLAYLMGHAEEQTVAFNVRAFQPWMLWRKDIEEALFSLLCVATQKEVDGVVRGLSIVNSYAIDERGNVTVILSKELLRLTKDREKLV